MLRLIRQTIILLLTLTLLTGVAYPLLITILARTAFPVESQGSLIIQNGRIYGSTLIGQSFSGNLYFWPRPSATSPMPNNAESSSGSNLSQGNPALFDAVKERVAALKDADPTLEGNIPMDLVSASASGLDPHISPRSAEIQVSRVAKARNLDPTQVRNLVDKYTEIRSFGILGEPCVNVLKLNLALDHLDWSHPISPGSQPVLYRWRGFLPEGR
jgi:potassium-transporting ATPase KdpC subunit